MEERLQKLIAAAGIASRRKAEQMILNGEVTVNGQVVRELGSKADPQRDHIKVAGKLINPRLEQKKKIYLLLNKPKGYLASLSDPQKRPLVTSLIPETLGRLYPVGRLDFNTEGLLILTNDGALTKIITTAREHIPKIYQVKVKGSPPVEAIGRLRRGIVVDDKRTAPAEIRKLETSEAGNTWFEITLYEGRNNQIRKMFDLIGHSVVKLRRTRIGHLTDRGLPVGKYRYLTLEEVNKFFKQKKAPENPSTKPARRPAAKKRSAKAS
ncbi:MAG: pseudouridine synthase [Acidobacteriota bacterium]